MVPTPEPGILTRLRTEDTTVLIIDFQERLFAAMPQPVAEAARVRARQLLAGARLLSVPVVATEQYPQGLGATLPDLRDALVDTAIVEKRAFSCCDAASFAPSLEALRHRTVVVAGMETHICVWQTVRDLRARGIPVHVCTDAVLSRRRADTLAALERFRLAGAVPTTVETVLFDLVRVADGETFKAISRLIR